MEEEIWKDIEGYEGLYQVSTQGNVRRNGKILSAETNKLGYKQVCLFKNRRKYGSKVHQLVARAFIPNPQNKPQINHIDLNPSNNNVDNLEWCTALENMRHAIIARKILKINGGKTNRGNNNRKLSDEQIAEIRNKYTGKRGILKSLAKEYNVSTDTIAAKIFGNKPWRTRRKSDGKYVGSPM